MCMRRGGDEGEERVNSQEDSPAERGAQSGTQSQNQDIMT